MLFWGSGCLGPGGSQSFTLTETQSVTNRLYTFLMNESKNLTFFSMNPGVWREELENPPFSPEEDPAGTA